MPRVKNKKKGSQAEKSHSEVDTNSVESDNEAEDGKRYGRRQIQSNWSRYRSESPKLEEDKTEKSDNFAALLDAPDDCHYFRFQSEKNLEREAANSSFGGHKFFNLDFELLSNGLACIPFYERVELDKSILSESDIHNCDKKAEESVKSYKSIVERYLKKLERENELPCPDMESKVNVNVKKKEKQTEPSDPSINLPQKSENSKTCIIKKDVPTNSSAKSTAHVNQGEEDLEDWLDSVLDD